MKKILIILSIINISSMILSTQEEKKTSVEQEKLDKMLLKAAEYGNLKRLTSLYKRGADINAKDFDNYTPLMVASYKGHIQSVEFFLSHGASLNTQSALGRTALTMASMFGHTKTIELILSSNAALGIKSDEIEAALNLANNQKISTRLVGFTNSKINFPELWYYNENLKAIINYNKDFLKDYNAGFPLLLKSLKDNKNLKQAKILKKYINELNNHLEIPDINIINFIILPQIINNFGMWMTVVHPETSGFEFFIYKIYQMKGQKKHRSK